jgi:hypothetical protein
VGSIPVGTPVTRRPQDRSPDSRNLRRSVRNYHAEDVTFGKPLVRPGGLSAPSSRPRGSRRVIGSAFVTGYVGQARELGGGIVDANSGISGEPEALGGGLAFQSHNPRCSHS